MHKGSAHSKLPKRNKFKFEKNTLSTTKTSNGETSSSSTSALKFFGKSFPTNSDVITSTPEKIETTTPIKPSFSDYCIGKTISFVSPTNESPGQNYDNIQRNLLKPLLETTFTNEMDISEPLLMTSGRHQTPQDQLCKPKTETSNFQPNCRGNEMLGSGEGGNDAEYMQTSLRTSKVSFKRKYKPLGSPLRHKELILMNERFNFSKDFDATEKSADNDLDNIVNTMNLSEKDESTTGSGDSARRQDSGNAAKYSYYALFFMILSNLIGLGLSLTFQILLFLKANADRFLSRTWTHWKKAGLMQYENNLLTLSLLIPVVIVVCLAYAIIWTCYGINKLLLTEVSDCVANLICFNFRIVSK